MGVISSSSPIMNFTSQVQAYNYSRNTFGYLSIVGTTPNFTSLDSLAKILMRATVSLSNNYLASMVGTIILLIQHDFCALNFNGCNLFVNNLYISIPTNYVSMIYINPIHAQDHTRPTQIYDH